jgi:hypothetical protein
MQQHGIERQKSKTADTLGNNPVLYIFTSNDLCCRSQSKCGLQQNSAVRPERGKASYCFGLSHKVEMKFCEGLSLRLATNDARLQSGNAPRVWGRSSLEELKIPGIGKDNT